MLDTNGQHSGLLARWRAMAGSLPSAFWLVFATTLVFLASWSMVFPFLGVHLVSDMHASLSTAGLVLSSAYFAAIPIQAVGGSWADRRGRKGLTLAALALSALLFGGLAFSGQLWLTIVLAVAQGATGWPLFLVASNAMVADLTPPEHHAEAYALVRMALNVGAALGPAAAAVALSMDASLTSVFLVAAGLCAVLAVTVALLLPETRPAPISNGRGMVQRHTEAAGTATAAVAGCPAEGSHGGTAPPPSGHYAAVLRDRRFVLFCGICVLTLYCFGHFCTTLPVYFTSVLDVSASVWGYLFAFNCIFVVVFQFPVIHGLRQRDPLVLLSVAALLLAVGIGGAAFAVPGWQLWVLVALFSCGEILFVPLSSSVVSNMATLPERGRYMGVWSLVWISGQGLAPAVDSLVESVWTARGAYVVVIVVACVAAVLFLLFATVERKRSVQTAVVDLGPILSEQARE